MTSTSPDVTASKPAATSLTLQGATLQFIVSAAAILSLLSPKNAGTINSIVGEIQAYAPMVFAVIASAVPFVMTVIGRFRATTTLH